MSIDERERAVSTREEHSPVSWQRRYARRLAITDLLTVVAVVFGTQMIWLGANAQDVAGLNVLDYSALSVLLIIAWMTVLAMFDTRSPRVIGYDTAEYRAIANGALRLFGVTAIISYLLQASFSRGYILISFPLGVIALIAGRWLWRRWLHRRRLLGDMVSRVLLVGDPAANLRIYSELTRAPETGYVVVGACSATGGGVDELGPTTVPVFGGIDDVPRALEITGADTVLVSSESGLPADRVRELSWQLEAGQQHLIMAPNLTDIGGPRIHMRPVAGLPLMHVETPKYTGPQVVAKRAFDIFGSGVLILLLSPVLLSIAVLVWATSRGPVLYGQERIGLNGVPFHMLKFRSMVVDADDQLKDDHDLAYRAWRDRRYRSGYMPVRFSSPLDAGSTRRERDPDEELRYRELRAHYDLAALGSALATRDPALLGPPAIHFR